MRGYNRLPSTSGTPPTSSPAQILEGQRLSTGRKVDRENFYGSDNDYEKVDADMITAKFEHDLTPNATIRNITRYGKTTLDRVTTGLNTGGSGLLAPSADP